MNIPAPPAPYTDFANQFQRGAPGVLPTGRFQIPQANVNPPNGGIGVPNQMQSGLNANDYTFQARIIDVGRDRADAAEGTNVGAMSVKPFSALQPYSLIFINPSKDVYMMGTAQLSSRTLTNPEDQPVDGCCLEYLMDAPYMTSGRPTHTAFERAMNPRATEPIAYNSGSINMSALSDADVDAMVKMGLLLPNKDLSELKTMLTSFEKTNVDALTEARDGIADILDKTKLFDKWRLDGPTLWSSRSDLQNKELDDAAGTSVFSNVIEGHAIVAELTTALKCHVMDTVYIVVRAILDGTVAAANFSRPEVCILTSRQLRQAFKKAKDASGALQLNKLGDALRQPSSDGGMTKVDRADKNKYVVLGGWKVGKVVDLRGVPAAARTAPSVFKGVDYYEIMCNIERCTAFELIRHLM